MKNDETKECGSCYTHKGKWWITEFGEYWCDYCVADYHAWRDMIGLPRDEAISRQQQAAELALE